LSFLVIALADGLSEEETIAAVDAGPDHVVAEPGYQALMGDAGFENIEMVDVTDEYLATLEDWIREWEAESDAIERLIGIDEFNQRQKRRRRALQAGRQGLLVRYLISARSSLWLDPGLADQSRSEVTKVARPGTCFPDPSGRPVAE